MNLPMVAVPTSAGTAKARADVSKYIGLGTPIAGILVSLIVAFFVVWPKFNEVLALRKVNAELATKATTLESKAEKLKSFNKSELEKQFSLAERLLPSDKGVFTFLTQLEATRGSTGVLLSKIDVTAGSINSASPSKTGSPAARAQAAQSAVSGIAPSVEIRLELTSSYGSLLQFLRNLYDSARVVAIDDLAIAAEGGVAVKTNLVVQAFWQQLPADLGAIEAPIAELSSQEKDRLNKAEDSSSAIPAPIIPTIIPGKPDLFAPF